MNQQPDRLQTEELVFLKQDLIFARAHTGVVTGTVVHVDEFLHVRYAGPIVGAPKPNVNWCLFMAPDDFAKLKAAIDKTRN